MTDVKKLVAELTLEEKASLMGGGDFWHTKAVERLGIPQFMMSDGPHGLRKQDQEGDHLGINDSIKAVCFPAACATASSFDTELIQHMGEVIGDECQAEDLSIVLGPAVNIKRSPLCGRNFEYFSEDPYLAGKMAAAYIRGVQSRHVGTSIKHFALNNQETRRMSVSSEVSERAIREIYFPAFEIAVKESQPKTVMCSYNKINGTYSADNEWLLEKVLRDEWGFEGFVMTDWGAVNDRVQGVRAGLELEMPGNTAANDAKIVEAVKNGSLSEARLNLAVERLLNVFFDYVDNRQEKTFDRDADHKVAAAVEEECAVLLENNGVLPLAPGCSVAYIGEYAEKPRYQGGGSSHINSSKVTSALSVAQEKGRKIRYVKGFPFDRDAALEGELEKAVEAAKAASVAVIFAGLPDAVESEGYDRADMKLPACQTELIEAVAAVQPNTVVVLHNGAPVEAPWADRVAAVLELYLGGQGVGEACDRLLFGEANPSGHLAETFPCKLEDNPSYLFFPGDEKKVQYAEGVYVGYRYYDRKKMPVRWAFGHGLSYTSFAIGNLRLSSAEMADGETLTVTADVTNSGDRFGKEVVQLYVADLNRTTGRPEKELKGFAKVALEPGETKQVSFSLTARDLSYFEERMHDWFAPAGEYAVLVGNASDNISCRETLHFSTEKCIPLVAAPDTTVGELLSNPKAAKVFELLKSQFSGSAVTDLGTSNGGEGLGAGGEQMAKAMMMYMPLKSLQSFTGMTEEQMVGIIKLINSALNG